MLVYHRTSHGEAIQRDGFLDREGTYGTTELWRGVWVADTPLDENEGAHGDDVLTLEIPDALFVQYEWVEDFPFPTYREALIPAADLNEHLPTLRLLTDDELEELPSRFEGLR